MARAARLSPEPIHEFPLEMVPLAQLRPHPRNYQEHPADEIEHLRQSLREHGVYRNIVCARDYMLLAGHGVVKAAGLEGIPVLPVRRLDLDPFEPRAIRVLIGDNYIAHLSQIDDRALTELLKDLNQIDAHGLLGTGFDASMLAALVYTTRPSSEIQDKDEAVHWVGMPDYENPEATLKLIISFRTHEDRKRFADQVEIPLIDPDRPSLSVWWPPKAREDLSSLRFGA